MHRLVLALALVASLGWLGSAPAAADDEQQGTDPASRMMLVLDSSGSMAEKTPDGPKRIDAAKDALRSVIGQLPDDQEVGLRVYGAKVFSRDEPGACTDSQAIVKPGTGNRDELTDALADYKPYGETPIGYALQQAGRDIGSEGPRTIVLVSDGEPTCDPDPCVVAEKLAKDGVDVRIDVVGLDVAGKARNQLKCVADKGRGTYYDVESADELVNSLDTSTARASRPFDLTGTRVEGTPSASGAPAITTGRWLDTFPADEGELWYRLDRTAPGSTFHVGATHRSTDIGNFGEKVEVQITPGPDTVPCGRQGSFPRGSLGTTGATSAVYRSEECRDGDTLYAVVKQQSNAQKLTGQPVSIAVYEEPPLADPPATDAPDGPDPAAPDWKPLKPGTADASIVPGTSATSAPVISDGTYSFDINPGETQAVAVPLDWGQDLQVQLDGRVERTSLTDYAEPGIQVTGPLGANAGGSYTDTPLSDDWTSFTSLDRDSVQPYRWGRQAFGVAYDNRREVEQWWAGSSIPGLRYVLVSLPKERQAPVPYTLTVKTNGTAGEGAPDYADVEGLTAPTADSPLVSTTGRPAGSSPVDTDQETAAAASGDDGSLPWLPIGLGVAGVAALGGAAVVLRRARTT